MRFLTLACLAAAASAFAGVSALDSDGRRIELARPAQRIVSLAPHVTEQLFQHLCRLIESPALRRTLGMGGLTVARSKFSFDIRNAKMLDIYREATR